MLGDAAGLAGDDVGAADRVEQRRLAVVDMAHDRDHRRARLQRLGRVDVGLGLSMSTSASLTRLMLWPNSVTSSSAVSWSIVWVTRDRHAHLEQRLDQVGGALGHAVGELLDGDRLGHDDVADLLGRRAGLHVGALFLLAGAAQRGERAGAAVVLVRERAGDGELAALAAMSSRPRRRARRLGALGAGAWPSAARRRGASSSSSATGAGGAAAAAAARLGLGGAARPLPRPRGAALLRRAPPRPGDSPRRGGVSSSVACWRLAVLAAAGFLERGEPRFLGLAQQFVLQLAARGRDHRRARRAARLRRGRGRRAGGRRGRLRRPARARAPRAAALRRAGRGCARFLTSTTTVFERPWLKLCLTLPVSTVRLRPSGAPGSQLRLVCRLAHSIPSFNFISRARPRRVRRRAGSPASGPMKARHRSSAC